MATDPQALNLARAIALTESGGDTGKPNYDATGASGEKGAYQWMPGNFQAAAIKYGLDPNDFSPANQDKVAYHQVLDYKTQGYDPGQIASLWNSGSPNNWQNHSGVNSEGVPYDTPAYVGRVKANYEQLSGGTKPPADPTAPIDSSTDPAAAAADAGGGGTGGDTGGGNILTDFASSAMGAIKSGAQAVAGAVPGLVKDAIDFAANSPLRVMSNVRTAGKLVEDLPADVMAKSTADVEARQGAIMTKAATQGYDYGYLGNATTFGADPSKSFEQNAAEAMGVGIDIGSFVLPMGKGEEIAGKGVLGKVAETVAANPKTAFSAAQGAAATAQAKAKGEGTGQAVTEGIGAFAGSLAFLGIAGKVGDKMSSFGRSLSQTKAGEIIGQRLTGAMETLKNVATPEVIQSNLQTFKTGVEAAAQKVAAAVNDTFSGTLKMLKPYSKASMMDTITEKFKNANVLRFPIGQDFGKVFASGVTIAKDDAAGLISKMEEVSGGALKASQSLESLATQITDARARNAPAAEIKQLTENLLAAQKEQDNHTGKAIAGGLQEYLGQISKLVMQPLQAGKNVPISVLQHFINFIKPGGTPTEEALGNQIQDTLYKAFEDKMAATNPAMLAVWKAAKESARQLGNTLDGKYATLLQGANTMQQLAEKFISGDVLPTPEDTKQMISLLGNKSVQDIREGIIRRLFENSQAAYKAAIGIGRPADLAKAGQAAAKVFEDFIAKAEKASGPDVEFMTADQLHFLSDAKDTIGGDLTSFAKNAKLPMAEQIQQLYDTVKRGMPTYTSNPSEFAGKIKSMALEDLQSAKALYTPEKWAQVGATVLKDIAESSKNIFSSNFDEKSVTKFVNSLGTLGGPNRDAIFKELFGDTPEVKTGVDALIKMAEDLKSLKKGSGSYTKALAHGTAAFLFGITKHPIMAYGQVSKAISEISGASLKDIESRLYDQLEKEGTISSGPIKAVINAFGRALKNKVLQYETGRAGAQAGQGLLDDTNTQ